jgi:hypothetical protein
LGQAVGATVKPLIQCETIKFGKSSFAALMTAMTVIAVIKAAKEIRIEP